MPACFDELFIDILFHKYCEKLNMFCLINIFTRSSLHIRENSIRVRCYKWSNKLYNAMKIIIIIVQLVNLVQHPDIE